MKPLTKPMAGWMFDVGKYIVHLNFAKTLIWSKDVRYDNKETQRINMFLTHSEHERKGCGTTHTFVIGPFKIIVGIPEED